MKSIYYKSNKTPRRLLTVLLLLLLSACGGSNDEAEPLAIVNGNEITTTDLDMAIDRLLGRSASSRITPELEKQALESLVMMRAIADKQIQQADKDDLARIDAKTARYREELLVEAYLRANADKYIPSQKDIRDYYDRHSELFGAETVYSYEILMPKSKPSPDELNAVLDALASAKTVSDWRSYADKQTGLALVQDQSAGRVLDAKLVQLLQQSKTGEASDVVYLGGKPQLVRVISSETTKPQPLKEVRGKINKTLAAKHLKNSIRIAADEVLKEADVQYLADNNEVD